MMHWLQVLGESDCSRLIVGTGRRNVRLGDNSDSALSTWVLLLRQVKHSLVGELLVGSHDGQNDAVRLLHIAQAKLVDKCFIFRR